MRRRAPDTEGVTRYRLFLARRREERELRVRMRRVIAAGLVPIADRPIELPAERVDLASGRLLDRRTTARLGDVGRRRRGR